MKRESLVLQLGQYPFSECSFPFGPEAEVFKVKGKMFALLLEHNGSQCINLKGMPADNEVLVGLFEGIIPGYHMNKQHWITVALDKDVNESMLLDLVDKSYKLVVSKLPKKERLVIEGLVG